MVGDMLGEMKEGWERVGVCSKEMATGVVTERGTRLIQGIWGYLVMIYLRYVKYDYQTPVIGLRISRTGVGAGYGKGLGFGWGVGGDLGGNGCGESFSGDGRGVGFCTEDNIPSGYFGSNNERNY
jgi:hypothetical protein